MGLHQAERIALPRRSGLPHRNDATTFPLARSLQVVWHGEANAAANGFSAIEFPGLGTVSIRCEPGEPRQIRVESAGGAKITTREASEDSAITEGAGPVVANLPNNGMVVVEMSSGQRILVASRWKLNDPNPTKNFCAIAGQVMSAGLPRRARRVDGEARARRGKGRGLLGGDPGRVWPRPRRPGFREKAPQSSQSVLTSTTPPATLNVFASHGTKTLQPSPRSSHL